MPLPSSLRAAWGPITLLRLPSPPLPNHPRTPHTPIHTFTPSTTLINTTCAPAHASTLTHSSSKTLAFGPASNPRSLGGAVFSRAHVFKACNV